MVSGALLARQVTDPVAAPTGAGISGTGVTAGGDAPLGASLALDGSAVGGAAPTSVPLVPTDPHRTTTTTSSSTEAASSNGKGESLPISTVIGACVGAFIGAVLLIGVGILLYKRSAPKPRHARRGLASSHDRRQSREWGKLEAGRDNDNDHWEGKYPPETKQISPKSASVGPMETLTMFKQSPSVRSAFTEKSDQPATTESPPTDQYHPNLAKDMATADNNVASDRPFLPQVNTGHTLSWDSSGMSFRSSADGGRMSPVLTKAIPTPLATTTNLHHAQSAEVVNYDGDGANPFEPPSAPPAHTSSENRKSVANPFFNAQSETQHNNAALQRTRSRAMSTVSRADTVVSAVSSHYTDYIPAGIDKGKGRAVDPTSSHGHDDVANEEDLDGYYLAASNLNPFADPSPTPMKSIDAASASSYNTAIYQQPHPYAAPIFQTTPPSPSISASIRRLPEVPPSPITPTVPDSAATNDPRAIQGLLAALEIGHVSPHQLQRLPEGLRVTSVATVGSNYSDSTIHAQDFPIPPRN